ncbi:MAG TPA: bifunctional N(6)-L-threonylcarbamoyladenine synthase/serine/threonine protein kinase [Candidatus Woesearchaeota archaeon]|nr:bifunctional N(6)-L-threonylcarbamoyladenine synthase/serine/threonine protein kinase [Candidatus Woesearchaeota archaeon]
MISLGIESTAHTFGVGIADQKGRILANRKSVYATKHGGMIPAKVSEHHLESFEGVLSDAVNDAGISLADVDVIAYSKGPGIGHTLRIGSALARSLSLLLKKPIVGVNHCIAHLEIGRALTPCKDPVFLYVSGANTQIIAFEEARYRIFGETLDIGVGNFIDAFAREAGLGFPGGPEVEKLAKKSSGKYVELPYVVKGMDFSFGGILTQLKKMLKEHSVEDLCFSLQETAFAMLLEASERAMAHTGKKELLLGGGVACNKRLQEMSKAMCFERGAKCFILENQFNADNGAMIAWLGLLEARKRNFEKIDKTSILPYWRTDEVQP